MEHFIISVNRSDDRTDMDFVDPVIQHIPHYNPDVSAFGAMALSATFRETLEAYP